MSELDKGFQPIKRNSKKKESSPEPETQVIKNVAVKLPENLVNKINDYGFWEAKNQTDVIEEALTDFFKNMDVKPMPEAHKKKMEENAKKRIAGMRKKKY